MTNVIPLQRKTMPQLGGSHAAAACGLDPHVSRIKLWRILSGHRQREETEPMLWGKLLQPVIAGVLDSSDYETMPAPEEGFVHESDPRIVGHPDGFVVLNGARGVLEIKTAGPWTAGEWDSDIGAPVPYLLQCQHYMALTGTHAALLACLIGGQKLVTREVPRNDRLIARMLEHEIALLDLVRAGRAPRPDGSRSAGETLREMFPQAHRRTVRLTGRLWDAYYELNLWRETEARATTKRKELEQEIQLFMGDAELAVSPFDDPVVKWGNVNGSRFDTKAFKEAHPDLYTEFTVTTKTRRFTLP